MAIRKGRCSNFDGCSKADKDVIQEVDEHDDFVCSECGRELDEIKVSKKKGGINPLFIIIGCLVIGLIIASIIIFVPGKEEQIVEPVIDELPLDSVQSEEQVIPNRNDTLVIKVEGVENLQDSLNTVDQIDSENAVEGKSAEIPNATTPPHKGTTKTTGNASTPSSHRLGFGTWTGGLRNGQPHGTGTMTYSTSRVIDSRDSKGRVAQPGEYVVGEWDNGHLVQGRWFKNDGTKEVIIVGKVG